jgi:hypothetical protein
LLISEILMPAGQAATYKGRPLLNAPRLPRLIAGDAGFHSAKNEAAAVFSVRTCSVLPQASSAMLPQR